MSWQEIIKEQNETVRMLELLVQELKRDIQVEKDQIRELKAQSYLESAQAALSYAQGNKPLPMYS